MMNADGVEGLIHLALHYWKFASIACGSMIEQCDYAATSIRAPHVRHKAMRSRQPQSKSPFRVMYHLFAGVPSLAR